MADFGDVKLKCDCLTYPIQDYIFMQDIFCFPQRNLADKGEDVLAWPGNLSDFDPIEKVWDIMEKHMKKITNKTKLC